MKYSEFKRKVEELGFGLDGGILATYVVAENVYVARVSKNRESLLENMESLRLSPEVRAKLFDILVEYARTPIEDRKDEKKYAIYPIRTLDYKLLRYDGIFTCCGYGDEDSFDIAFPAPYEKGVSTTFSESEAKEICDYFGWDFDKVAVEVDDDK